MKKLKRKILLICFIVFMLCGCEKSDKYKKLDLIDEQFGRMTRIFELETLECRYHNVARSKKYKNWGLIQKNKTFWVEYDSVANISFDISKMERYIDKKDKIIYVKLPEPKIECRVVDGSIQKTKESKNGMVKLVIDTSDIQEAIDNSEKEMKKEIEKNTSLYGSAAAKAEIIIRNFVEEINNINGSNYTVNFDGYDSVAYKKSEENTTEKNKK